MPSKRDLEKYRQGYEQGRFDQLMDLNLKLHELQKDPETFKRSGNFVNAIGFVSDHLFGKKKGLL